VSSEKEKLKNLFGGENVRTESFKRSEGYFFIEVFSGSFIWPLFKKNVIKIFFKKEKY